MKKTIKTIAAILTLALLLGIASATVAIAAPAGTGSYRISTTAGLNVRETASTGARVLTAIPYNTTVNVTQISGVWGKVTYDGKTGWISLDYATKIANALPITNVNYQARITTAAGLNVRSEANTTSSVLTAIPYNTKITVNAECNGMARVSYAGKVGWVSMQYIAKVSTTTTSNVNVSLSVPLYKQTDSRWSGTYIGTKTIGAVGCTTCCIAMMYSYKYGTTYPNTMRNKLSYSNNDLYWSSATSCGAISTTKDYSSLTQAVMQEILNQLKANKPVLLGSKNSSGQHWIVITGYSGPANPFSTANFKINDPMYSRTTLSQHMSAYPTLLKICY